MGQIVLFEHAQSLLIVKVAHLRTQDNTDRRT